MTITTLDIRPYSPDAGSLCGRCGFAEYSRSGENMHPVVARLHSAGWQVNLCAACLTPAERAALNANLEDGLYRSGLR